MSNDRNILLKIASTGEYIAIHPESKIKHLTMQRAFAYPFLELEAGIVELEYAMKGLQLEREDWLIQLWKNDGK